MTAFHFFVVIFFLNLMFLTKQGKLYQLNISFAINTVKKNSKGKGVGQSEGRERETIPST